MRIKSNNLQFGIFPYGLSDEEEERAALLHSGSIIVDMLYWGPCTYRSCTEEMENELIKYWEAHLNPGKASLMGIFQPIRLAVRDEFPEYKHCWEASGVTAGNRQVMGFTSLEDFSFTFGHSISLFDHMPWVIKALCSDDIRRAKIENKYAAWISTQLARGIDRNFIDLLEPAYALGLRMIQLTYNTMNLIGAGCTERTDAGVSHYGAKVIESMNELGIIVDTAHCGRQTTLDACKLSKKPVIASHTSAQAVYMHARGKSDKAIRAIAETGGIVGVVTVPFFLAPGKEISMNSWLDHIDYCVNLVGYEHVAIGTDWPMPMPKSILRNVFSKFASEAGFRAEDNIDTLASLVGFDDYRDFPNLTRGLVKRGYSDKHIKGILGENFLRVFKEVCG